MKRGTLLLAGTFLLAAAFAAECRAQMPGPRGPEESGVWQDEAGPGGAPGMEPGREGRPWGPGLRAGDVGQNEEQYVADLVKKYDPAFSATLAGLKKTAPMKYAMLIRIYGRQVMFARKDNDEAMEKDSVRAFSLEYQTKELARGYENAAEKDKDAVKKKLEAGISELFDLRLKVQEGRIKHMEKDLARLRKNLESRRANKPRIVEERVGQLTGEGYGW